MAPPNNQTKQRRLLVEERRQKVAMGILSGMTFRELAQTLTVSLGTIAADYKAIHTRWTQEYAQTIDEYKQIELHRLDQAIRAIWVHALQGPLADRLAAVDRIDKLINTRAKILGLYAPQKTALTDTDGKETVITVRYVSD